MGAFLRRLFAISMIVLGGILFLWGASDLFTVKSIMGDKFVASGKDSAEALVILLLGMASIVYGVFDIKLTRSQV
ncbi:hypothetical protein HCH_01142 [Hahella chejuensis KCTC 2396]|uniref:Uncharacterized protein n=1 Tax=Hahella chejuensis (strain KCTC 2396) TaxID=349521 RepID=Q2SMV5_HAHCH|nr:hypothetical protein [Hahella chejuensis]ABC28019.1 hypothetical protein HCH_01142 [Hahella chejuensis KCTC 2396]